MIELSKLIKAPHKVTSHYGNRVDPISKENKFHKGIDLSAPTGTPITAPTQGKAVEVYFHATGGRTLIFDCADGIQLRMCHLEKVNIVVGQLVSEGTPIALVGNTGRSTGPHLHLGVVVNGTRVDPLTVFKK